MAKKIKIPKSNADLCRAYRARKKERLEQQLKDKIVKENKAKFDKLDKDAYDRMIEEHIKELKLKKLKEKTEKKLDLVSQFLLFEQNSVEPVRELREQFQQSDKEIHIDLFNGQPEGTVNKLDLISHQRKLKLEFDNRAE